MQNISFIIFFLLVLTVQGFFISGISMASEGETKILPDGSEEDSEMIFYPLKKWIMKKKKEAVFYKGIPLAALLVKIKGKFGDIKFAETENEIVFFPNREMFDFVTRLKPLIEKEFDVFMADAVVATDSRKSGYAFFVFKETHVHSKWLRNPTFGCIKCMPSIWGTLTFWPIQEMIFGPYLPHPWIWLFIWIVDIVCLVPVCYIINKIIKK